MAAFPVFSAGDHTWTVACDGQALMVKGMARRESSGSAEAVNSLIPLASLTHAALTREVPDAARLTLRVWDGDAYYIGVLHRRSPEIIAGLQSLVAAVAATNVAWPMSASRATAARAQLPPGYLRDACFLGQQGKEEFWSPLSDLSWSWANNWAQSTLNSRWPLGAAEGTGVLLALLDDSLVIMSASGDVTTIPFDGLGVPEIIVTEAPSADPASVGTTAQTPILGLRISSTSGEDQTVGGLSADALQPIFRFLLMRWAEAQAGLTGSAAELLTTAASDLDQDRLSPAAYAALVDAVVAVASGVSLSREFPPRERDYLRTAAPLAAPARQPVIATGSPGASQRPRPGVNARHVAAGAAGGAALWSLFSE